MPSKKTQYVVVPASGLIAAEDNPQQVQFFQSLQQTFASPTRIHRMSTHTGLLPVKVLDSIGENKAKLIECGPEDLPALRASHPSVRILPVVYYKRAVVRHRVEVQPRAVRAHMATKAVAAKPSSISIKIVASDSGKPIANAMVVAFTDFGTR